MINRVVLIIIVLLFYPNSNVFSWNDTTTHPKISERAVVTSFLDQYLQNQLKIANGIKEIINEQSIIEWLEYGAEKEDDPNCRAGNHFHNPYHNNDWWSAGLSDFWWAQLIGCNIPNSDYYTSNIRSNLTWATGYITPTEFTEYYMNLNQWDWSSARESFYSYLTGLDYSGNIIALDQASRDLFFADSLRAVGQVMHLLQDMAVPAHVRDDMSRGHTMWSSETKWLGNGFEQYVQIKNSDAWYNLVPVVPIFSEPHITQLWDTDQLSASSFPGDQAAIGLAEYTSMNFFSEYSVFKNGFAYPSPDHCVAVALPPVNVQTSLSRYYLASTNGHPGEQIDHLAVVTYLKHFLEKNIPIPNVEKIPWEFDENCYTEYAEKLIPRAVGYSAALLDYFFRGRMRVKSLPVFKDNALQFVRLNITNITPSEDAMVQGRFVLVLRYTPKGADPQCREDIFVTAIGDKSCEKLAFDEEIEVIFTPQAAYPPIPIECWDSVRGTLVYSGQLGQEPGCVVGKVLQPGRVLFNEEWDQGFIGNHFWEGSLERDDQNYYSEKNVTGGMLDMQLAEIAGVGVGTCDLWYDFTQDDPNGLLITENTVLEAVVAEMSTTPAGDLGGGGHIMELVFNRGSVDYGGGIFDAYRIMYKIDGPYLPNHWPLPTYSDITTYLIIPPEVVSGQGILLEDIHSAFARSGIAIPDSLYLRSIHFVQQIQESPETYHLSMAVDFVRIVEMGDEE